ncbi:MAG: T9SS type A sorting domain-containing protein [Gillisia sp.]
MKNVFKNSLLVVFLSIGFMMGAAEDLDVKVVDNQNLKVALNRGEKGDVLLLKDTFGKVLFKDSIGEMVSYKKTFNLELVPEGIYYLNLDKNGSLLVTAIKKTQNGLEIDKSSGFVFKPCFEIENSQVRLFLSNPKKMKAEMKVYDSNGILVGNLHSKELVLQKTLDFSRVPSGTYSVEITIDGQIFFKELKIG